MSDMAPRLSPAVVWSFIPNISAISDDRPPTGNIVGVWSSPHSSPPLFNTASMDNFI